MAELKCPQCDEDVSGPDAQSVKETMDRHMGKRHGSAKTTNRESEQAPTTRGRKRF